MRLMCLHDMSLGQHVSSVSSEDPGHKDRMQGSVLPGGQRSVLRPLFTQPLRRRRSRGAAGSRECLGRIAQVKMFIFFC